MDCIIYALPYYSPLNQIGSYNPINGMNIS